MNLPAAESAAKQKSVPATLPHYLAKMAHKRLLQQRQRSAIKAPTPSVCNPNQCPWECQDAGTLEKQGQLFKSVTKR